MKTQLDNYIPTTDEERNEKAQITFVYEMAIERGMDIETDFTDEERRKLRERIIKLLNIS